MEYPARRFPTPTAIRSRASKTPNPEKASAGLAAVLAFSGVWD